MNAQLKPVTSRAVTIQVEPWSDAFYAEIEPLAREQWREIANYQDSIPLDVDPKAYQRIQDDGRYIGVTVRDCGRLVGYAIFFLIRHLHYKSSVFAMNDVIWLEPAYRARYGVKLILESEKRARAAGAVKISWHVKLVNGLQALLEAKGYKVEEVSMGKLL